MRSPKKPNPRRGLSKGETWGAWQPAKNYFGVALGKHGNPNLTLFRKRVKRVSNKAA